MNESESPTATYATRLTATSPAAIAVIELSGPSAERFLLQCWRPATELPRRIRAIRYGTWTGPSALDSEQTDLRKKRASEDVVICWVDENIVEIHCHGGALPAERILRDLSNVGAQIRSSHDRTARQASDPIAADALVELEKATTEITTAILLDQVRGALTRAFDEIRDLIVERRDDEALGKIDELLLRRRYGLHLTQPWRLAMAGPPNAGKSSLLNAILGYDRAIVDASAGTTRDALNELTSLVGWPCVLIDTAGLHDTTDAIEREGVERAHAAIETADAILLLIEPRQGWTYWHDQIVASHASQCIAVHSKSDLGLPWPTIPQHLTAISVSAKNRAGLDQLYEEVVKRLVPIPPQSGQAVPFLPEHVAKLERLLSELSRRR